MKSKIMVTSGQEDGEWDGEGNKGASKESVMFYFLTKTKY